MPPRPAKTREWPLVAMFLGVLFTVRSQSAHQVPDGFVIDRVASEPEVVFPMFAAFDERGRLFVAESSGLDLYAELSAQTRKCRVKVLEDRDGDGRFETATAFADKLVFPMGLVWRDGKLYAADPPDLVTFEDTDADGRADKRTAILSGFGHKDNGSLHGLEFGPDNWLYLTMGSPDGYRLKRDDGSFIEGTSGALIRCRADGSGAEVLSRGFVNLVEIVFLPTGEIIGSDNWYQHPSGGVRDALVHLVEGGLYPFESDVGTPQPVTGDPLPPLSLFPAVALSGLTTYQGASFPDEMRGNLFSAQHNSRAVGRHVLTRTGSTFRSENSDFVTSDDPDFHPSDILEDADGSLLVVDTGGWYVQHCPTGRIRDSRAPGGIFRVRFKSGAQGDDPWGKKLDWVTATEMELAKRLSDSRPAVHDRAQQQLIKRGAMVIPVLSKLLSESTNRETCQRALWALSQIPGEHSLVPLRLLLSSPDPDLVSLAARLLGRRADHQSSSNLSRIIETAARHGVSVRIAAAEALAHCGDTNSLNSIWRALAAEPDQFLEHALIHAAHRLADVPALESALTHSHPRVQRAALILLNQAPRPKGALAFEQVNRRLASPDTKLRQTSLGILEGRSEWSAPAAGMIENWLKQPQLTPAESSALRDLVSAFQTEPTVQQLVGTAMNSIDSSDLIRVLLIELAGQSSLEKLPASWIVGLKRAIGQAPTRALAVKAAARLQLPELDEPLRRLAEDATQPVPLRLEAVRGTVARRPRLSAAVLGLLTEQLETRNDPVSRLASADSLRRAHLTDVQLNAALDRIRGDSLISPGSLLPAFYDVTSQENAAALLARLTDAVGRGWRPSEADLEPVFERLPKNLASRASVLRDLVRRSHQADADKLRQYEPLLKSGNAERGRDVFFGGKVACGTCHLIGDQGGKVGPDLTKVGAIRSGRDILESIVLPSASFAQGYDNYRVVTKDGEAFTGVLANQTADAVVVRGAAGGEVKVPRNRIQEMDRSTVSLMPEGLDQGMTAEEFRDLLAFLLSLK